MQDMLLVACKRLERRGLLAAGQSLEAAADLLVAKSKVGEGGPWPPGPWPPLRAVT